MFASFLTSKCRSRRQKGDDADLTYNCFEEWFAEIGVKKLGEKREKDALASGSEVSHR